MSTDCTANVILFDFGGVIAEEGFKEGLRAIAVKNRLAEETFIRTAFDTIYATGYVLGQAPEAAFWASLREQTGLRGEDMDLRQEILSRFIVRQWVLELAEGLNRQGIRTGILSDQTDWLDVLNDRYDFFRRFDVVFNSYRLGDGKRNPDFFDAIAKTLAVQAESILFIDDDAGNCDRARQRGWQAIQYIERSDFLEQLGKLCPHAVTD